MDWFLSGRGSFGGSDLLDRRPIALPAEILPGLAIRDQGIGQIVLEAFRAISNSFDVFQNFLFVGCASHAEKVSNARAAPNAAKVPNRLELERQKVLGAWSLYSGFKSSTRR